MNAKAAYLNLIKILSPIVPGATNEKITIHFGTIQAILVKHYIIPIKLFTLEENRAEVRIEYKVYGSTVTVIQYYHGKPSMQSKFPRYEH